MSIFRPIVLSVIIVSLANTAGAQDFEKGLRALRAGTFAAALAELRPLAENGHGGAQYLLGTMFEYGRGVSQDDGAAVIWYRSAAENDIAFAQYRLGVLFDNGWGVDEDRASAVRWYKLAAEQGHLLAQHDLALMYFSGQGVEKNPVLAIMWMKIAVDAGDERMVKHYALIASAMSKAEIDEGIALAQKWRKRR
ncbi:MAG: tetratricopeptide repeat protein [Rhizobiaceae bacterium]